MRELQFRQALACSKSFMVLASSILITLCTSIAVLSQCDPDERSIKYSVFIDSQSDSTFSTGEFGIANDIVAIHDTESKSIEFAMFYGIDISRQNIDSTPLEFQNNHNGVKDNSLTYESVDFEQDIGTEDQELAMMPVITSDVTSACECTDPVAGFFTNEVTITSEDGQKWYVDQAIGAFDTTSTDGNLVTFVTGIMGDSLTQIGVVGTDDNYVLRFYSLDGNPWQLSLRNEQDNFVVIQGAACDNTIISVSGESALCIGTTEVYSVTNPTAGDSYTFSLPPASGSITIISAISAQVEWSVNGGPFQLSVSNTGTNVDCQSPTIVGGEGVMVGTADGPLSCIGHTNASLNEWCELLVKPSTVSSQSLDPLVPYSIMLTLPNGTIVPDNILTGEHIGLLVEAKLIEGCGNNACWGTITVEDKLGPVFNCVDTEVFCFNLDEYGGPLALDACDGPVEVEYSSQETVNLPNDQEFVNKITRTYIAEDSKGNTATPCVVEIYVKRLKFDDITWPNDITGEDALICSDIDESGTPSLEISKVPTVFGYPLLPAQDNICDFTLIYEDKEEIDFGCITSVLREYTAIFWDPLSNTYATDSYTQVIEVEDDNDPIFQPLDDIELTSGFDNCTKEVTILYPEGLDDQCSDIDQIDITWTPIESNIIGGSLQNIDFPVDIVLPLGESLVTYRAYDECNNSSTASITVIINPNAGPTASCKDMNVALGSGNGGFAYVPASSIDKSNSPLCGSIVSSHVRRLDEGANCYTDPVTGENISTTEFGDYVIFCCEDAGKTIMVELQIIDNYGGIGLCTSMITVQDSNAPTISTLPNDTIECGTLFTTEQLDLLNDTDPDNDVDLSQFGFPIIDDECGNADTEVTTIWVPTIVGCGRGTIVRTFTASDSNNTSSISQTITVTKEPFQDSYIEQFEVLDTNICDLTLLAPELLPVPFNGPQITGEGPCDDSMVSIISEDTYAFPEDDSGYCFKIIRNWTVMSWCDVDAMGAPLSFQRQQIIRIVNIDTPVIENTPLEQIVECVQEGDESSFIEVIVSAKNNCTISNNLEWSYAIINTSANPDTLVELSPFELNFGDSIDVSGVYAAGDYRLDFVFRDRCGSEVTGEQTFSVSSDYCYDVEDCVGPLSEVDINLIGCDYPQDVADLVDVISLEDSGIPNIDCTECIPIDTAFTDILIDSVDELVCDTIRRTLILTFNCPFGPNLIVERPHFLVLNNTNNPVIVVPSIPDTVFTASNCDALVDIDLAISMDGCSTGVEITNDSPYADSNNEGDNASGIYPVGNHIVRYTAKDLCGNMTVDSIVFSVNDGEAPLCNTQDITLTFFDTDLISINADTLDNFSTDNCVDNEDLIFTVSQSTFSCENLGYNDLILTVSDGTLSSACAVTVEILDSIPPICDTQDIVVYLDEDGEVIINAQMVDNGSVTGCQGIFPVSQNVNPSFFKCEEIGDTTILVNGVPQVFFRDTTVFLVNVFTSGSFNIDFCQSTVSFIDTFPPICNVMDITVDVGETVEGIDFDNGSIDNCGGSLTFDVDINTFTCDDVDELNSVMVTVTDRFGNAAICEANVTVLSPSEIMCVAKDTVLYLDSLGIVSVTPFEIGYASFTECGIDLSYELSQSEFTCNDAQGPNNEIQTILTVFVDDPNVDPVECNSIITLLDTIFPRINCLLPETVSCADFDETFLTYGIIDADQVYENCSSGVIIQDTVFEEINVCGIGTYTRRWIATDAADNSDTCEQVITVVLGDNPIMEEDLDFPSDTLWFFDCYDFDLDNLDTIVEIDNIAAECFNVSVSFIDTGINLDMPCNDTLIRTYTVYDSCQINTSGFLVASFEQIIIINDITAPIATGPEDIIVTIQDTMTCLIDLELIGSATDECDLDQINLVTVVTDENGIETEFVGGDASGSFEVGVYDIIVIASDNCGNSSMYPYTVTVLDSTYTNFTCLRVIIPMEGDTMVQVLAEQLIDTFQIFNCLGTPVDTAFSYSDTDINDTIQVFGCESVDDFTEIYVFLYIDGVLEDSCVGTVQLLDPLDLCMDGIVGTVDGTVFTSDNEPVSGVLVNLDGSNESIMTDEDGYYAFPEMLGAQAYEVIPIKDDDPMNGVTTLDLILIQRHILGLTDLDSPYDLVAADIDASGTLSVLDILQLRKMILGIYNEFPENKSWRMVDKGFVFWHSDHAEEEEFPETYNIETLISPMKVDFIGIKTGDVNGSVTASIKQQKDAATRSNNTWNLQATDRYVKAGQSVFVEIAVSEDIEIQGFQLAISTNKIGDISISSSNIQITEDNYLVDKFGVINISWNTINYVQLANGSSVIELEIKPLVNGKLSEMMSISDVGIESQTYLNNEVSYDSAEIFWNTDIGEFALYQNTPNPWTESTDISFKIPIDSEVTINISSINGQRIKTFNGYYESGIHSIILNDQDLMRSGVYYYEMRYGNHIVLEKMILLK